MVSPELLETLGLIGLFVQAFCAWIFVAVLAALRGSAPAGGSEQGNLREDAYRNFLRAFTAIALALSVMVFRYWPGRGIHSAGEFWRQGQLASSACYGAYMALKGFFGVFLVQGSLQLAGREVPPWIRRSRWPLIALLGASPIVFPAIDDLLVVQAPVLVLCALAALRVHWPLRSRGSGARIVAVALAALALTWSLHAAVELTEPGWTPRRALLSLNSFIDLGVQLALGVGLVVSLLQDAHRRALEAEQEEARLRRELEKDDKLRALGSVVSGVAHELNNPLTVILGYAELLQDTCTDGTAAILSEQAERCRGIVRNLSALAGQSVHPFQELCVETLVRRVVRGLSPEHTSEGRGVWVEGMDGLRLCVDRIGLEQVLANLMTNALDASPPGGVVTVRARRLGDEAELAVEDEGSGVAPEHKTRLFEPFFTTKPPGKGTGLGLAIAHAIVRAHDGTMHAEDGPEGRGTAFVLRLPARLPDGTATSLAPATAGRRPPQGRLLVVDDDAPVRSILERQAQRRGWNVTSVGSAEEALALSLTQMDVVLCDVRMPGMGGAGFYDLLEADASDAAQRVLFMTGDLASPQAIAFAERCERPLLQKPFDFDEVFARIEELAATRSPA